MKKLPIHPLANLLPRMSAADYDALKSQVVKLGRFIEPAVIADEQLLDGRHRAQISEETGIELPTVKLDRRTWPNPIDYVIAKAHGRNMTDSQKAAAAVLIAEKLEPEAAKRSRANLRRGKSAASGTAAEAAGETREVAAGLFGVSPRYVQDAKLVRKAHPALFAEIFDGKRTVAAAKVELGRHEHKKRIGHLVGRVTIPKRDLRLLLGDNVEVMNAQPAGSARVVFADPPYNNGWKYDGDPYGDKLTVDDYLAVTRAWMKAAVRLLDERGSIFVLIDDNYSDFYGVELRKLGLFRRNTIYWWEHFPVHTNGNFPHAVRLIHYYTKAPKGFVWNADAIKVPSKRQTHHKDKRAAEGGKVPDNVWAVTRKVGNATDRVPFDKMPPQIPVEVPERCILVASNPGDTVCDPFNGNGITAVAALKHQRRYVGIDRSRLYLDQSEQWIKAQLAEHRGGKGK